MPKTSLYSFNAGELSPYLDGRPDIAKYASGCRKLENFLVLPYGAAVRRPGTRFVAEVKDSTKKVRLVGFEYSTEQTYMLEFGDEYIRFYKDGGLVRVDDEPMEVETPYLEAELNELQFVQSADVMFIVHGNHAPHKLSRMSDISWTIEELEFSFPPFLDENITDTTLAASAVTGEDITVTASAALFEAGHVGAYFQLTHVREDNHMNAGFSDAGPLSDEVSVTNTTRRIVLSGTWVGTVLFEKSTDSGDTWTTVATYTANTDTSATESGTDVLYRLKLTAFTSGTIVYKVYTGTGASEELKLDSTFYSKYYSDEIEVSKCGWNLQTHGTWTGKIEVERSFNAGTTWVMYKSYTSEDDYNVNANGNEAQENALYRLKFTISRGAVKWEFMVEDYYIDGIVKISAVAENGLTATADVIQPIGSTVATEQWNEGAFSIKNGYPGAIAFFENRMLFAGTKKQPQTIMGSKSNDWLNFERGDFDDDALFYTINSDKVNAIRWLAGRDGILVGTSGSEWKLSAPDNSVLTPTNVKASSQSTYGSNSLPGLLVNSAILFVQRQGLKVREFVYNFQQDTYVSPDMTMLAEHITAGGIINIAYQRQPDSILWCVTADGNLIGMTYERDQDVVAWHRHTTAGSFESVAVIPGANEDEIWVAVKRSVNGADVRYVERFAPRAYSSQSDGYYVDCGITYDDVAANTIPGLDHLEGETVSVCADNATIPDKEVIDGEITLTAAAAVVHAGLPYSSKLMPMKLDLSQGPESTMGRQRTIIKCFVRFHRSLGGFIGTNENNIRPLIFHLGKETINIAPTLFSGDYEFAMPGGYDRGGDLLIVQSLPQPMTITNIITQWEVAE